MYRIITADFIKWLELANRYGHYQNYFHFLFSDFPYNLESIQKRFSKPGSKPARYQKDGSFVRQSRGFMNQDWDVGLAYHPEIWEMIKPLLKPGAFVAGFTHTRKQHRLAAAMEGAGFLIQPAFYNYRSGQVMEVPGQLGWMYGSGRAAGTDISKAIDRAVGVERKVIGPGKYHSPGRTKTFGTNGIYGKAGQSVIGDGKWESLPTTPLAKTWHGYQYGSPLSPEIEPIIIAQKPWEGHRRNCIIETGAGAMDIAFGQSQKVSDRFPGTAILEHHPECRQDGFKEVKNGNGSVSGDEPSGKTNRVYGKFQRNTAFEATESEQVPNYICHPDCHIARFNEEERTRYFYQSDWSYEVAERLALIDPVYYSGKVQTKERNAGLDSMPDQIRQRVNPGGLQNEPRFADTIQKNNHPTLKPIKLTKFLSGLFLPPEAYQPRRILIPCAGTMSEAIGAVLAGWDEVTAIELKPEYARIGKARLKWWSEWLKWGQSDVDTILASISGQDEEVKEKQLSFID